MTVNVQYWQFMHFSKNCLFHRLFGFRKYQFFKILNMFSQCTHTEKRILQVFDVLQKHFSKICLFHEILKLLQGFPANLLFPCRLKVVFTCTRNIWMFVVFTLEKTNTSVILGIFLKLNSVFIFPTGLNFSFMKIMSFKIVSLAFIRIERSSSTMILNDFTVLRIFAPVDFLPKLDDFETLSKLKITILFRKNLFILCWPRERWKMPLFCFWSSFLYVPLKLTDIWKL